MPAVQWEIGQVKTRRKGTGEITNKNSELSWIKLISTSYWCWWFHSFMSLFLQFWPVKRKQTKIPAVQWAIGQVKTGWKGTGAELSWAKLSGIELNWAELSWILLSWGSFSRTELNWIELNSSSFDLSNLALDRNIWNKTETDKNTSCPMGNWTSQNWTKRDGS